MIHPAVLMAEDTLKSAQKSIESALRHLKGLEAPYLRLGSLAAGGPHRETAMGLLRNALHQVNEALAYHHDEARRLTPEALGAPQGPAGRACGS